MKLPKSFVVFLYFFAISLVINIIGLSPDKKEKVHQNKSYSYLWKYPSSTELRTPGDQECSELRKEQMENIGNYSYLWDCP